MNNAVLARLDYGHVLINAKMHLTNASISIPRIVRLMVAIFFAKNWRVMKCGSEPTTISGQNC